MHARRVVFVACVVPLVVSCGGSPSMPTEEPDVRGSWGGVSLPWRWTDSPMSSGTSDISSSTACEGRIEITEQDGGSFVGRYTMSCSPAGRSSGAVVGRIDTAGQLRFQLQVQEGWDPAVPPGWSDSTCRVTADNGSYEGRLVDGSMSVRRVLTYACLSGGVMVTARFEGIRG